MCRLIGGHIMLCSGKNRLTQTPPPPSNQWPVPYKVLYGCLARTGNYGLYWQQPENHKWMNEFVGFFPANTPRPLSSEPPLHKTKLSWQLRGSEGGGGGRETRKEKFQCNWSKSNLKFVGNDFQVPVGLSIRSMRIIERIFKCVRGKISRLSLINSVVLYK